MKIIGLCGLKGSGKSTSAAYLKKHGFVEISFAEPMKVVLKDWFDFSNDQLWGSSEHREMPDPRYKRADGLPLTARHALQTMGTEWGRACDPDLWVRLALRAARDLSIAQLHGTDLRRVQGVVFSDCRFKNELRAIRKAGGFVIRLSRGMPTQRELAWMILKSKLPFVPKVHASEFEQVRIPDSEFDFVIDNDDISLGDLHDALDAVIST